MGPRSSEAGGRDPSNCLSSRPGCLLARRCLTPGSDLFTKGPSDALDEERTSGKGGSPTGNAPGSEDQDDDQDDEGNGHLVGSSELQPNHLGTLQPHQQWHRHLLGETYEKPAKHRPVWRPDSSHDDGGKDQEDDVEAHRRTERTSKAEEDPRGRGEGRAQPPRGERYVPCVDARRLREFEVVGGRATRLFQVLG